MYVYVRFYVLNNALGDFQQVALLPPLALIKFFFMHDASRADDIIGVKHPGCRAPDPGLVDRELSVCEAPARKPFTCAFPLETLHSRGNCKQTPSLKLREPQRRTPRRTSVLYKFFSLPFFHKTARDVRDGHRVAPEGARFFPPHGCSFFFNLGDDFFFQ